MPRGRRTRRDYRTYLTLGLPKRHATRRVSVTHGVTGSGKTTRAQAIVELSGAVRVRSDVERKRLHGARRRRAEWI